MKRIFILLLLACLLLVSCNKDKNTSDAESLGGISETTVDTTDETTADDISGTVSEVLANADFVYYAFGDSIAFGYGLPDNETMSYGYLFSRNFEDIYYRNFAVSGHKTDDMLEILSQVDVSDADLITISIGANNLLGYAADEMVKVFAKYGLSIVSDFTNALTGKADDATMARVVACLKDIENAFTGESFAQKAENGLNKLKTELPQIFEKIKSQNPEAVVIIQTIYNPYKGISLEIPGEYSFDLSSACNDLITPYNDAITEIADEYGCVVLDVYTDFENATDDYINAGFSTAPLVFLNYDPHPNAKGHERIAELLYTKWKEIKPDND
ncbi:MAG: SGNH/GDSL hydrolase family protein [Eubacteriales bacterium]|jgi:lysophospholipase L1-like esterase